MVNQLVRFMNEEEGATAIEYGLLAALIAAVIGEPDDEPFPKGYDVVF